MREQRQGFEIMLGTVLGTVLGSLLSAVLALGVVRVAAAREPAEVWIELQDCAQPPYDPEQLSSSLALELSPYGLRARVQDGAAARGSQLYVLLARCDARAGSLWLHWQEPGTPPRERELSLRDVPWPARARTLALLISDALRPARWRESQESAHPAPEQRATGAPHALAPLPDDMPHYAGLPLRSDPYPEPYRVYWSGALRANWVPRVGVLIYGAGTGLAGRLAGHVDWAIDAAYAGGRSTANRALYDLQWLNAALGADYNLASERQVQLGPRLTVAHVLGYGETERANDVGESLVLLGGRIRLSPRLRSERVSLDLLLDAGYPLLTLHTPKGSGPLPWTAWVFTLGTGLSIEL